MQKPEIILDILTKRSERKLEIDNIYKCMYNPEWYYIAYNNISKNKGILTSSTNETINDISLKKINIITEQMKLEQYKWHKNKIINLNNRNIEILDWRDKLVQEVIKLLLNAIYEPRFSDASHGYRPNKGCHTALGRIYQTGRACDYFIQGDIKDCFSNIDHNILINILKKTIKDGRFIELIRKMLKTHNIDNFKYNKTYSGITIGGIVTPILFNIYMNEFDQFINNNLVQKFNIGDTKPKNKEYEKIKQSILRLECKLKNGCELTDEIRDKLIALRKKQKSTNSVMSSKDCNFRRLIYTRYADDWIITFTGTFNEAVEIKNEINDFLINNLKLNLNDSKTKIIQSTNQKNPARFLNYNIIVQWDNTYITNGKRALNGNIAFLIPDDVIRDKKRKYMKNNKPIHISYIINESEFDIINKFQYEYRGICQYYKFARNQKLLNELKYIIETSLAKTLSVKLKISVSKIFKKFKSTKTVDGYTYKVLKTCIKNNKTNKEYEAYFGAIPLKRVKVFQNNSINDNINFLNTTNARSSLSQKLLNRVCELCGATNVDIEMHHIHALKDIKKNKSDWAKKMSALNRKVIALCHKCHKEITYGKYDKKRIK